MPIKQENKSKYPANWKQISEDIRFNRAENKCEVCGVENHKWIFRCAINGHEYYQTGNGDLYDANNSQLIETNTQSLDLIPTGKDKAIKVILTVAHLDHNPENCEYSNLKAMCQRCHNRYDAAHRIETRNSYLPNLF